MIIEKLNGTRLDIEDYGLTRLFHHIPSAEIDHTKESMNGIGEVVTETTILQRTITVEIGFKVSDIYDYYLLRDELNGLFMRRESFYIIFKREPYKRWLVKLDKQFTVPVHTQGGKFSLDFRTVKRFAESIASTYSRKEWDENIWWWNGAITWDDPLQYSFTTNNFTLVNLGNMVIDPSESDMDIRITIKATTNMPITIRNVTNGSVYVYGGTLTSNDILVLDGPRSLKNGVSVFKDTLKKVLKFDPGENKIEITGGTVHSVDFDFRFPFL